MSAIRTARTPAAATLANVNKCREFIRQIETALDELADASACGEATWPNAGDSGKAADDLGTLANFFNR